MSDTENDIEVVLIADRPGRAKLLHDMMAEFGVSGLIRRLVPGELAIQRARQQGSFRHTPLPDLFFFDFSNPDKRQVAALRKIAFGPDKASVPVILLTSPESEEMLDAGEVDGGHAVMLTPTSLSSCIERMRIGRRKGFFKALKIFYEFGPILVRTPEHVLSQESREDAIPA